MVLARRALVLFCMLTQCSAGLPQLVRTFPIDHSLGLFPHQGIDVAYVTISNISGYDGWSESLVVAGPQGVAVLLDLADLFEPGNAPDVMWLSNTSVNSALPFSARSLILVGSHDVRELRIGDSAWNFTNVTEQLVETPAGDIEDAVLSAFRPRQLFVSRSNATTGGLVAYDTATWTAKTINGFGNSSLVLINESATEIDLVAAYGADLYRHTCPSAGPPCSSSKLTSLPSAIRSLMYVDLNGDKENDFLVVESDGTVVALEDCLADACKRHILASGLAIESVTVASNASSSRPQIIAVGSSAGVWVLTSASDQPSQWMYDKDILTKAGRPIGTPYVHDVDGDGWLELFLPRGTEQRVEMFSWSPKIDYDDQQCWDCLNLNGRCLCCCAQEPVCQRSGYNDTKCMGLCGNCRGSTDWQCNCDFLSGGTCLCNPKSASCRPNNARRDRQIV